MRPMTMEKPQARNWLTLQEAADELGVSRETIRKFITVSKKLNAYRIGSQYRIDRTEFNKFVEDQRTNPEK